MGRIEVEMQFKKGQHHLGGRCLKQTVSKQEKY